MKTISIAGTAALMACAVLIVQAKTGSSFAAETVTSPPANPAAADVAPAPADAAPPVAPISGEQAFNDECGACHMAYPAVMLPARSWQAITADLTNHFGEDASLDPATTQKITEYLVANAAETTRDASFILQGIAPDQVPLRITEMRWWQRAHYEVPAAAFTTSEVQSKSNCLACHSGGGAGEGERE
jgi:mono/diheme cytochrome c family protein